MANWLFSNCDNKYSQWQTFISAARPRKRFSLLQAACKSPCWPLSAGLGKHLYDAPEVCGSMCHLPEQLISLATSESTQQLPAARKISQHIQEPFGDSCLIVPNAAFTSSIYEQHCFSLKGKKNMLNIKSHDGCAAPWPRPVWDLNEGTL